MGFSLDQQQKLVELEASLAPTEAEAEYQVNILASGKSYCDILLLKRHQPVGWNSRHGSKEIRNSRAEGLIGMTQSEWGPHSSHLPQTKSISFRILQLLHQHLKPKQFGSTFVTATVTQLGGVSSIFEISKTHLVCRLPGPVVKWKWKLEMSKTCLQSNLKGI